MWYIAVRECRQFFHEVPLEVSRLSQIGRLRLPWTPHLIISFDLHALCGSLGLPMPWFQPWWRR